MATIDLGKIALVWKGTYAAGTTYESKDVVQFTDSGEVSSYIYVNASGASGQTPSTGGTVNTTYWNKMAGGAAGIWASGLALGSAGQVVKVNSGGNALEFGTDEGGGLKQFKTATKKDFQTISTAATPVAVSNMQINITPSSASNKILVKCLLNFGNTPNCYAHAYLYRQVNGGGYSAVSDAIGNARGGSTRCTFGVQGFDGANQDWKTRLGGFEFLDSPNTTNQVDYKIYISGYSGSTETVYINREENSSDGAYDGTTISTLSAMELASGVL